MRLITLNERNVVPSLYTNQLSYQFPTDAQFEKGDALAIQGVNLYYSNFNIDASLGNNTLRYYWVTSSGGVNQFITVNLTIPNGLYNTDTLNKFLQYSMIQNNHYLINNTTGDFVFYLEIIPNFVYYANQINSYVLPTALPAGFSTPVGFPAFPATPEAPILEFPNSRLARMLGYTGTSYPPGISIRNSSWLSNITPQITDQNIFIVRVSLCESKYASVLKDIVFSFAPNKPFGAFLNLDTNQLIWNSIKPGYYANFRVELLDENYRPLRVIDPNMLITLAIWKKSEDGELEIAK